MYEIKIFLFGFALYYIITFADIIFQIIQSYASVIISRCNVKIAELSEGLDKQDDGYRIGFHVPDEIEYYDDDFEDKKRK